LPTLRVVRFTLRWDFTTAVLRLAGLVRRAIACDAWRFGVEVLRRAVVARRVVDFALRLRAIVFFLLFPFRTIKAAGAGFSTLTLVIIKTSYYCGFAIAPQLRKLNSPNLRE
jgi:hypothetical protein